MSDHDIALIIAWTEGADMETVTTGANWIAYLDAAREYTDRPRRTT